MKELIEKIEIRKIEKEQFDEYKNEIEKIHNENVFPNNGYLMDEDYITNADFIFVALLNNKVVGYASINTLVYEPDEGDNLWITIEKNNIQIKQIAISKEFQGLKIGTLLLDKAKAYAKSKGINNIYLYSSGENKEAHKFYERNGFKKSGTWSADEYMGIKDFQSYLFSYKSKKTRVAHLNSTACYLKKDNKILFIKFSKKWNNVYAPPGGKFETGESPLDCIIREYKEETGLTLINPKLQGISYWKDSSEGIIFVYVANEYKGNLTMKSEEGILEWINAEEISNIKQFEQNEKFIPYLFKDNLFEGNFLLDDNCKVIKYEIRNT